MTGPPETDGSRVDNPVIDAVTGTLARGALSACLEGAIQHARRADGACSVFLFDVDHFKSVNDAYGHARGDAVLRQLAERTLQLVRGADVLIRYGGDEFVLLLPGSGRLDAVQVASRLVEGVKSAPFPGTPPLSISVSLGVATFPDDAGSAEELLAAADRRNYLAKRRGRGRAVGDDLATGADTKSGRLLERDAALAAAQDFLVRLATQRQGALRVAGEPGAGHTRFLAEVSQLARLRGFTVRGVGDPVGEPWEADWPGAGAAAGEPPDRVLVVADTGADRASITDLVHELTTGPAAPAALGVLYALHDPAGDAPPLPLAGTVTLAPLSAPALGVWLRTALQGEPSPSLVEWLAGRSRGVIAHAGRELDRLSAGGSLERGANGGWTISAAVLARASQARRQLPTTLSTLIGREHDTARVAELVGRRRLVTLVGTGGIGKTRLSLAVASAVADDFDSGAVFVPLAEATTTELVVSAVAQVLEVAEVPGEALADTVVRHLAERNVLLVLDNFEQVLTAAPFVAAVLSAAPEVTVLATSRERLRLSGEQVFPVPPLPLPDLDHLPARVQDLPAELAASPALALFVARAREAAYDLHLTPADVRAAAQVCHRLDGLPLAIELAAARCDTLTPTELLGQLTERLDVLADGPQDLPSRQQALRATIDWSFALLDTAGQDLMRRLAVFAGGCTAEAVTAVCPPDGAGPPHAAAGTTAVTAAGTAAGTVAARLSALTDKNLLASAATPDGTRYTMLETIRAYANERLAASTDSAEVHARHAAYLATFAEQAGQELTGPAQVDWHTRINREYLNLRAAFEWTMAHGDEPTAGRIALGLGKQWRTGRHLGEGREWYRRVLDSATPLADPLRARLLEAAAFLAAIQDDNTETLRLGAECLRLARELADPGLVGQALNVLGIGAEGIGDYDLCRAYHREGLALGRERGDRLGVAVARGNLTLLALRVGDLDTAQELALLNLELERGIGNARGVALTLECLGQIQVRRGDATAARPLLSESLQISRQLGDVFCEVRAVRQLGLAARLDGDPVAAYRQIAAALRLSHGVGYQEGVATGLGDLADLLATPDPVRAAGLLAAAEAVEEQHRLSVPEARRASAAQTLDRVRVALGDADLAAAWAIGRCTPLDDLVEDAAAVDPTVWA